MVIAKTASRNIAFKAAKISETAFAGQSSVLTREVEGQSASINEANLEDLGSCADIYILILIRAICRMKLLL